MNDLAVNSNTSTVSKYKMIECLSKWLNHFLTLNVMDFKNRNSLTIMLWISKTTIR